MLHSLSADNTQPIPSNAHHAASFLPDHVVSHGLYRNTRTSGSSQQEQGAAISKRAHSFRPSSLVRPDTVRASYLCLMLQYKCLLCCIFSLYRFLISQSFFNAAFHGFLLHSSLQQHRQHSQRLMLPCLGEIQTAAECWALPMTNLD